MKDSYPQVNLVRLCRLLGVTRQALYQHRWHSEEINIEAELIIQQVIDIRKRHPVIGTRKLYFMLQPFLLEHQIKIGRDKLFDLLASYNLLVRRRRRRISTTQSYHRFHKYPNLIREMKATAINQLWVSDITYYKTMGKFVYLSFVTDAYSHKIIGFQVAETLETIHSLTALEMAIKNSNSCKQYKIIHHSDRGIQYCSDGYVKLLQDNGILISMTENGDPLENPVAERVNGIIKEEYLNRYQYNTIKEIEDKLNQAVNFYNNERPHMSCSMFTPDMVHEKKLLVEKKWKTYYKSKISAAVL
ncbi:MAG: IS3 family transposase [Chitinophagaceae bacterium]